MSKWHDRKLSHNTCGACFASLKKKKAAKFHMKAITNCLEHKYGLIFLQSYCGAKETLQQSIFILGVSGLFCHFYSIFDENRCHIMWHLILVCTVCLRPFYGFPGKYGLILLSHLLLCLPFLLFLSMCPVRMFANKTYFCITPCYI